MDDKNNIRRQLLKDMNYELLFNVSADAIMLLTPREGFLAGNPAAVKMFGCRDEAEFISQSPEALSPSLQPDGRQSSAKAQEMMAIAMDRGSCFFEWTHKRMNGEEFFGNVLLTRFKIGGNNYLQATVRDITENKMLIESQVVLAAIVESSDDAIISKTLDGRILSWNKAAERMYGYTAAEAIGKNISIIVPKQQMEELLDIYKRIGRGERLEHFETVRVAKDGRIIPVSLAVSPVKNSTGSIIGASAIARDITQRKFAEQKLKEAVEEWNTTFNAIADLMFIADRDNNIIRVNKAFTDFFKKPASELIGKKCYSIVHGNDKPWPACPFEMTKKDIKVHTQEVSDPHIGLPLLVTTSPIFNDKGEFVGIVHIAKDISKIKDAEQELKNKITDLERFQNITIDRELKMKELKARIAELEARAGKK